MLLEATNPNGERFSQLRVLTTKSIPAETAERNTGGAMNKFSYRVMTIGLCVSLGLFSTIYAADSLQKSEPPHPTALSALAQIGAAGVAAQYDKAEQLFVRGKESGLSELQM